MAMPNNGPQIVTGVVESANDSGIRIDGSWLNYSRNSPDVPRPVRGQRVTVTSDDRWIRALEVLDGGAIQFPQRRGGGGRSPAELRDIRRLACLKAAAAFGASRPDLKSAEVLMLAERWLAWIEQPERKGG